MLRTALLTALLVSSTLAQPMNPPTPVAEPFALHDVRLADGPFKDAQALDEKYLLSLDADRFLARFYDEAKLPRKAEPYGGWELQGVAGQTLGHYLSALALMYAATGDEAYKTRVDYIVSELARCQAQSADGYVMAVPEGRRIFAEVKAGKVETEGFALNGGWVPWYTIHKLFAGLVEAERTAGSKQAGEVVAKLADWAVGAVGDLPEDKFQTMLRAEHGGMAEALADVYALTENPKHLALAKRFTHQSVFAPLAAGRDELSGLHANTQVPKLIGYERLYQLTGDAPYHAAAETFWHTVVANRTYAQGGNSDHEHFFPPERTRDNLSTATAETCNVYNMLRLTKQRFALAPSRDSADFYERALFNQILGSQDPKRGMFTYFQSLRPGGFKVYSDPENAMWCCVGTGMENHARYGEAIYFRSADALWVNLFIASEAAWKDKGVRVTQTTRFPDEPTTRLTFAAERPTEFALKLRVPGWVAGEPTLKVNGASVEPRVEDGYAVVKRMWNDGDAVEWTTPMAVRAEALHAAPDMLAFRYGPVTLAADLGTDGLDGVQWYLGGHEQNKYKAHPAPDVAPLVGSTDELIARARPTGEPLTFTLDGFTLRPFARTHFTRYTVYFQTYPDVPTYRAAEAKVAAAREAARQLDARTVDVVRVGEQQPEVDHAYVGQNSFSGPGSAGPWRDARDGGFFQYTMSVDAVAANELRVTYFGSDGGPGRAFDILVDGTRVASVQLVADRPNQHYEVAYPIPPELTRGKARVDVRFASAGAGKTAGGVFGVRVVRGG